MKKEKNLKRTRKNKTKYIINFLKKIKYKNIIILILFILSYLYIFNNILNIIKILILLVINYITFKYIKKNI